MNDIKGNKGLLWVIVILVLINIGLVTSIWVTNGKHRPPPPREMNGKITQKEKDNFLIHELELSKEQAEKFRQLKHNHQKNVSKILDEMKILKDSLFDGNTDSSSVKNITNHIGKLQTKIEILTYYHFKSVDSILNDEQKEKFNEMKHGMLKKMFPPPPLKSKEN